VIQKESGMVEKCHSVQGVHWCNKKIDHTNNNQSMFLPVFTLFFNLFLPPSKNAGPRGPRRAEIGGGGGGAFYFFLRRPRTHKRHPPIYAQILLYAQILSTHTDTSRSHASR
jgi:hypothetical protein